MRLGTASGLAGLLARYVRLALCFVSLRSAAFKSANVRCASHRRRAQVCNTLALVLLGGDLHQRSVTSVAALYSRSTRGCAHARKTNGGRDAGGRIMGRGRRMRCAGKPEGAAEAGLDNPSCLGSGTGGRSGFAASSPRQCIHTWAPAGRTFCSAHARSQGPASLLLPSTALAVALPRAHTPRVLRALLRIAIRARPRFQLRQNPESEAES